jgi:hypothetical protein
MELKRGSRGPLVYTVQEQLNARFANDTEVKPLQLNGEFDQTTHDRVIYLQKDVGLTPTGVVDDVTGAIVTRSTFDFKLARPPLIEQSINRYHCWAAATSAWLMMVPGKPFLSPMSLVAQLRDQKRLDPESEGLPTRGWTYLAHRFGMGFQTFGGSGRKISTLTIDYLYMLLKSRGFLLIAFNVEVGGGDAVAHTVVGFGVRVAFEDESGYPTYRVWIMDPWNPDGQGGWKGKLLSSIKQFGAILVLWPGKGM